MQSAKEHFKQNLIRIKSLGQLYKVISNPNINDLEPTDILRAQYVMLVSALDHFIHEVIRLGMLEIYKNERKYTKDFQEFILALDKNILFKNAVMEEKNPRWLDYQIRRINGYKSFQQAEKISEAIKLIIKTDVAIRDILDKSKSKQKNCFWSNVANHMKRLNEEEQIIKELNFIIERRNQIAHEADIEPTYGELREMKEMDIEESIIFIENIVESIFLVATGVNR